MAEGRFERVAILGLGLLGGSVALAARERGAARTVVGTGRRRDALEEATRRGVIDASASVERAVESANLVVLATPVTAMAEQLRRAAPHLRPGTLVTDVGSVKGVLAEQLPGLLPPGVPYVGSHPMAGSHLRGVEHARADLFEDAPCVVTATAGTSPEAVERIVAFWERLGARVVRRAPDEHDAEVAWVSHVPHVLAFAFARSLESAPGAAGGLGGSGFRDFTRIAQSDAELWSDILVANAKSIAGPLRTVAEELRHFAAWLEAGDAEALERGIARARAALARTQAAAHVREDGDAIDSDARSGSAGEGRPARSGGANPEIQAAPVAADPKGKKNE
jgi:prephenate dehydrogenase